MLPTPLDQFKIIPLFSINLFCLDLSITKGLLINIIILTFILILICFLSVNSNITKKNFFFLIPNSWQSIIEKTYNITIQLLFDNLSKKGENFFPFISVLFLFILFNNLFGLIPYSFTITSHLIITFFLALSIFIGINSICLVKYKSQSLSLFIPAETSFFLAFLIVPIEFISFIFKPISLGVRLFANIMAGHTLLKVVIGFSWSILLIENFLSVFSLVPFFIIILLMGLELGVAIIQAYVFIILTCIYLNDGINLHL